MRGFPVVWIPGFDHAGIATQAVVEKNLYKTKNLKRSDISKEEFLSLVNNWKDKNTIVIRNQLKSLGTSLDWSREYYTMSEVYKTWKIIISLRLVLKLLFNLVN